MRSFSHHPYSFTHNADKSLFSAPLPARLCLLALPARMPDHIIGRSGTAQALPTPRTAEAQLNVLSSCCCPPSSWLSP